MKRVWIVSLALLIVLCSLPLAASQGAGNEVDYTLVFDSDQGQLYGRSNRGVKIPITEQFGKWKVAGNNLILEDGFEFSTISNVALKIIGIGDAILTIHGNVRLTSNTTYDYGPCYGIDFCSYYGDTNKLTICGNGCLTVEATTTAPKGWDYAVGIRGVWNGDGLFSHDLIIRDCTVNAIARYIDAATGAYRAPSQKPFTIWESEIGILCGDLYIDNASVTGQTTSASLGVMCVKGDFNRDGTGVITVKGAGSLTGIGNLGNESVGISADLNLTELSTGKVIGIGDKCILSNPSGIRLPTYPIIRHGESFSKVGFIGTNRIYDYPDYPDYYYDCDSIVTVKGGSNIPTHGLIMNGKPAPKTGDSMPLFALVCLLVMSMGATALIVHRRTARARQ